MRGWLLTRLDMLLSESLRRRPPSELIRCRLLVGFTFLVLALSLIALVLLPMSAYTGVIVVCSLLYISVLVLTRRSNSLTPPATLLCMAMVLGSMAGPLLFTHALYITMHAAHMLLPAFAVYLLGARPGLVVTGVVCVLQGLLGPLYQEHFIASPFAVLGEDYLTLQLVATSAYMGSWGLSALHSTARDDAQATLERTLRQLRDSEGKLLSLIESTDDLICSLDTEGRVLTANSALKQAFLKVRGVEPLVGQPLPLEPGLLERWQPRLEKMFQRQRLNFEEEYTLGDRQATLDVRVCPIMAEGGRVTGTTIFARDITARKQVELRLAELHRTLVDISRRAGMAEIATGVLHNVGNTLNSLNISASLVTERLRKLRVSGLARAVQMLREHSEALGTFLTTDPRGGRLPAYLEELSRQMGEEQRELLKEMQVLNEGVEHIKTIVSMQQMHARPIGAVEQVQLPKLIDEALRLQAVSFKDLSISIERDYSEVPPVIVDRHRLLQILMNLLSNARHALAERQGPDRRLRIGIRLTAAGQHVLLEVADNGMGIAQEHVPRLFSQGFTTRKTGHGFGLHISALTAAEMKGRLSCVSPGPGQGATFTLELPLSVDEAPL